MEDSTLMLLIMNNDYDYNPIHPPTVSPGIGWTFRYCNLKQCETLSVFSVTFLFQQTGMTALELIYQKSEDAVIELLRFE